MPGQEAACRLEQSLAEDPSALGLILLHSEYAEAWLSSEPLGWFIPERFGGHGSGRRG